MVAKAKEKRARAAPVALNLRWTPTKREAFLAALVDTANVAGAARTVGLPAHSAYKLRAKDMDFSAAWDAALEEAYSKLELMLLRRATYGEACDGADAPAISTSFALAIAAALSHAGQARRARFAARGARWRFARQARGEAGRTQPAQR